MTQWKCFVPDTPSFCDHIWSCKNEHKMALVSIILAMDTRPPEKLAMVNITCFFSFGPKFAHPRRFEMVIITGIDSKDKEQWRIQDFPPGGGANSQKPIIFLIFLLKTA